MQFIYDDKLNYTAFDLLEILDESTIEFKTIVADIFGIHIHLSNNIINICLCNDVLEISYHKDFRTFFKITEKLVGSKLIKAQDILDNFYKEIENYNKYNLFKLLTGNGIEETFE